MLRPGTGSPARIIFTKPNVHGMAIHEGRLFFISIREIFPAPIKADGTLDPERRVAGDLPDAPAPDRTIGFGPDGMLYVSVGSTCNDCEENNPENATLLRMRPDGSRHEIVASGLRNTIGFAWQPGTATLYGLDNGVDTFGDDEQPEELNRIEPGKKYGWPYILGDGLKHPRASPRLVRWMIGKGQRPASIDLYRPCRLDAAGFPRPQQISAGIPRRCVCDDARSVIASRQAATSRAHPFQEWRAGV